MALLNGNPNTPKQYNNAQLLTQGLWQDPQSGLIWMRCALGQQWEASSCNGKAKNLEWKEAVLSADRLSYADKTGWRLPTTVELKDFLDHGVIRGFEAGNNSFSSDRYDELWTQTHTASAVTMISVEKGAYVTKLTNPSDNAYSYAVQSSNFQQKADYFKLITELDPSGNFRSHPDDLDHSYLVISGLVLFVILLIALAVYFLKSQRL